MVSYDPGDSVPPVEPTELAEEIATIAESDGQVSNETVESIRESATPLSEPIGYPASRCGSTHSVIRNIVLQALKETDGITRVGRSKTEDEQWISVMTHPSTLEAPNRLCHPASLAKLYQYGYRPESWAMVDDRIPESVDSVDGGSWEFREMGLVCGDGGSREDIEREDQWFRDSEAVETLADRVTDDDVSWSQYIPWYRATTVPTYRLTHTAQALDWTEYPDHPATRPTITDRFEHSANPQVGDFIRMAMLQELERSLPSITDLTTGPEAWTTNRISLAVTPMTDKNGHQSMELCPRVALQKLTDYGYRPIDAWRDEPAVGYESDDPGATRRFEFARGQALQAWVNETQLQSPLFNVPEKLRDTGFLHGIDYETLVACAQSEIVTYQQLHNLAEKPEGKF